MTAPKNPASGAIGIIFARAKPDEEIRPKSWELQMDFLTDIAKSANALLCVFGEEGCGKTTFLRQFAARSSSIVDFLNVTPATPSLTPGWLSQGIMQWLSSDSEGTENISIKLAALAENSRPILACIDGGDFIDPNQLVHECVALLNLADASALRLSILVCCSPGKANAISNDHQITSRLIYNKSLELMSAAELTELANTRLKKANLSDGLDKNTLLTIAQSAGGSPIVMIRRICERLGLDVPALKPKNIPDAKAGAPRKTKKTNEAPALSIDELLAPPSK